MLDRAKPRRAFRRLSGAALEALLPEKEEPAEKPDDSGEGDSAKGSEKDSGEGSAEKE